MACEYFDWADRHPIQDIRHIKKGREISHTKKGEETSHKKKGEVLTLHLPRALTLTGFFLYAGITRGAWNGYSRDGAPTAAICENIEAVIRTQKFENAAVRRMCPTLISRDIGLSDKTETRITNLSLFDVIDEDNNRLHEVSRVVDSTDDP